MGVKKKQKNLHRKITHTRYTGIKKIGDKGPQSWLQKEIIELDDFFYRCKVDYSTVTDEYIEVPASAYFLPLIGGGGFVIYSYDELFLF